VVERKKKSKNGVAGGSFHPGTEFKMWCRKKTLKGKGGTRTDFDSMRTGKKHTRWTISVRKKEAKINRGRYYPVDAREEVWILFAKRWKAQISTRGSNLLRTTEADRSLINRKGTRKVDNRNMV